MIDKSIVSESCLFHVDDLKDDRLASIDSMELECDYKFWISELIPDIKTERELDRLSNVKIMIPKQFNINLKNHKISFLSPHYYNDGGTRLSIELNDHPLGFCVDFTIKRINCSAGINMKHKLEIAQHLFPLYGTLVYKEWRRKKYRHIKA